MARPSVQWNGARVGALIGAVGGVLFVVLNAWPLGEPWANVAIGIGVAWFLWDLRAIMRVPEDPDAVRLGRPSDCRCSGSSWRSR